jgi:integrase
MRCWHARRMSVVGALYAGRAFIVRVLGYSGVRNSELCDLRIGKVRLHDRGKARFHIPDAKTETGIREVEMSPDLADAFVTHLDRARRLRRPECARRSRQPPAHREGHPRGGRARQPDPGAARSAAAAADHPAHTPPDICLERTSANKFDVKWVMGQVGHADSKMTMDVYTHLQQRLKREHGEAFEAMIREAEELMHGDPIDDAEEAEATETASDHDEDE